MIKHLLQYKLLTESNINLRAGSRIQAVTANVDDGRGCGKPSWEVISIQD